MLEDKYSKLEELAVPIKKWLMNYFFSDCHVVVSQDRIRVVEGDIDTPHAIVDEGCEFCRNVGCGSCVYKYQHQEEYPCKKCKDGSKFKSKDNYCKKCGRRLRV